MATLIKENGSFDNHSIQLSKNSCARLVTIPTTWQVLRVGIRIQVNFGWGTETGSPDFSFGLCSGTTNKLGDATTTHFVGLSHTGGNITTDGDSVNGWTFRGRKRVGTTDTWGGAGALATNVKLRHAGGYGNFLIGEITKGSPNYSIRIWTPEPGWVTGADARSYHTPIYLPNPTPVWSNNMWSASQTLAVDEATDGTLNAVAVYWNKTTAIYLQELYVLGVKLK